MSLELIDFDVLNNESSTIKIEDENFELSSILPVRNTVLFPRIIVPVIVNRPESIDLIRYLESNQTKTIAVITQKNDLPTKDITLKDVYKYGTVCKILKVAKIQDDDLTLILQGQYKFKLDSIVETEPHLIGNFKLSPEEFNVSNSEYASKLLSDLKKIGAYYLNINMQIAEEATQVLETAKDLGFITYFIANYLDIKIKDKQKLLALKNLGVKIQKLIGFLEKQIAAVRVKNEVHDKVHSQIHQQQRDFYLRQQLKVLQDELNDEDAESNEIEMLTKKAEKVELPQYARDQFDKELKKIKRSGSLSQEYSVGMNYCEFLINLPWQNYSQDNYDLNIAESQLDKDHYGLKKVKERILEHLAILKLKSDTKAPILCLVGPPGVGKTSLVRSIAKAMNKEFIRIPLGGLHDEAEIRGHRRTYIGAMAGKLLQNIKRSQYSNPLILLDEVDKIGQNWNSSPSFALLEVLDTEQNHSFLDNYLEIPYDLSKVLFIATANDSDNIDDMLLDRMEVVHLEGYVPPEKLAIAKKHLVPKIVIDHGLEARQVDISDEVILELIHSYTWESGVRELERKLSTLVRKIAKSVAKGEQYDKTIQTAKLPKILDMSPYYRSKYQILTRPGVAIGLSWTGHGGDILFIETALVAGGDGNLKLSGRLGETMNESAQIAFSYLKSYAHRWSISNRFFEKYDVHIHFPEGAVRKDGPSAGCAIFTAMLSLYTQRKVRDKLAMTGEMTLRGDILPIGGHSEKLLAAHRAGIQEVIFPAINKPDVERLDFDYVDKLTIHYVKTLDEVVELTLTDEVLPMPFKLVQNAKSKVKN